MRAPYEDIDSVSLISSSMIVERKSRLPQGDKFASYVIPDNSIADILLKI